MYSPSAIELISAMALVGLLATPLHAQSSPDAAASPAASATMATLLEDVESVESKLTSLAEAMPEDTYDWRPGEGVRSVSEVLMHIAADNYFIPAFAGVAPPAETGIDGTSYPSVQAFEAREVDKTAAIAAMRASFAHLKQAMRNVDDQDLASTLDVFGQETTGLDLWVMATTHLHEHLGQNIAYARTNGVVPPWSQ